MLPCPLEIMAWQQGVTEWAGGTSVQKHQGPEAFLSLGSFLKPHHPWFLTDSPATQKIYELPNAILLDSAKSLLDLKRAKERFLCKVEIVQNKTTWYPETVQLETIQ